MRKDNHEIDEIKILIKEIAKGAKKDRRTN
ncbi:MAG: hypothetical protein SCARUB_00026 [Candidatus Scalindua rubra]|uniref:Uncharacterized protein n=1 Tax=Candidatus Scalindua rubra TaxID=1872076 RepID=A0A1E3XGJ9_9BACT|nr:MAG: hypothetical protein SCARUB_00026 [Candidatus Scalindua rubra]